MKIIDAFPFFNEIDVLKIRLGLLYEKVDLFIICESNITHSGFNKNYNFLEYQNQFAPWMDKIVFLQYEPDISNLDFSKKDSSFNTLSAPWTVEIGQRNFLCSFLAAQQPNDVAMICDVDEIWDPALADAIRSGRIQVEAARIGMKLHYYYLNCFGLGKDNSTWVHPFFAKVGYIKLNPNLSEIRTEAQLPVIGNAGWHFSYLGGAKAVSDKVKAMAHQEFNTVEINELKHLEQCINLGIDCFNRPGFEWAFRPIDWYPEQLRNQMIKFPHLIRSSLI